MTRLCVVSLAVACWAPLAEAQTIRLLTEHYPPYNIDLNLGSEEGSTKTGVGGASTEIVLEMMRRSGYAYTLELLSWKRAYALAQESMYTGVFSTTRTAQREALFKWVGPIAHNNYVLLAMPGHDVEIEQWDDMNAYSIGAYRGSAGASLLQSIGVEPELVRSDHLNTLKLQRNRIDMWITGNLYGPYLAKQYGLTGLEEVYTLRKAHMYLAFHPKTPNSVIRKLNLILDKMRREGFLDRVYSRYR